MFMIPDNDQSNFVGNLIKSYLKLGKAGKGFSINGNDVSLSFEFTNSEDEIISLISEFPFRDHVKTFNVSDDEEESVGEPRHLEDTSEDTEEVFVLPGQITMNQYLEGHEKATDKADQTELEVPEGGTGESEKIKEAKVQTSEGITEETATQKNNAEHVIEVLGTSEAKPDRKKAEKAKKTGKKSNKFEEINEAGTKVFEEEAQKANSFDDFVERMGKFVKIGKVYYELYHNLVKAALKLEDISVSAIYADLEANGISFIDGQRNAIYAKVTNAFKRVNSNTKLTAFLIEIVKYKDYNFEGSSKEIVTETAETSTEVTEEAKGHLEEVPDVSESVTEKVATSTEKAEEVAKDSSKKEVEFKILTKELLDTLDAAKDLQFSSKVGIVLDSIKAKNDEDFYRRFRGNFAELIVRTAGQIVGKNPEERHVSEVFNTFANMLFGTSAHLAKAFIYQSLKDYCKLTECTDESLLDEFLNDMIKLM
jgi:hypothetical protein